MADRFSDLDKRVFQILKGGGDPKSSNVESDVRNYWTWRTTDNGHELDPASKRGKSDRKSVLIRPFGVPSSDVDTHFAVIATKRTLDFAHGKPTLWDKLNIKTEVSVTTGSKEFSVIAPDRFKAAQVRVRELTANAPQRTSRITKRKYNTKHTASDKGYIIPFGRGTNLTQQTVVSQIGTAIEALGDPGFAYSFTTEVYPAILDTYSAPA